MMQSVMYLAQTFFSLAFQHNQAWHCFNLYPITLTHSLLVTIRYAICHGTSWSHYIVSEPVSHFPFPDPLYSAKSTPRRLDCSSSPCLFPRSTGLLYLICLNITNNFSFYAGHWQPLSRSPAEHIEIKLFQGLCDGPFRLDTQAESEPRPGSLAYH